MLFDQKMRKFDITQETVNALNHLRRGLVYFEENNLLNEDFCSDFFSDVLDSIGKDYEWWSEL